MREGGWTPLAPDTRPGDSVPVDLSIAFPPEPGGYRIYVSPIDHEAGWLYDHGSRFLMIDAVMVTERARVVNTELTTQRVLRWRSLLRAIPRIVTQPFATIARKRG